VSDLSFVADPRAAARLLSHVDREGKLPRALDALGPLVGRDVVLVGGGPSRARLLAAAGARLTRVEEVPRGSRPRGATTPGAAGPTPSATAVAVATRAAAKRAPARAGDEAVRPGTTRALGLEDASADAIVAFHSAYRGVDPVEMAEVDRVLRPDGRLLVVHDYGRDDVSLLMEPDRPELGAWSRRDGPFLRGGFRIHVVHCWWTFDSTEEAAEILEATLGDRGRAFAEELRRPRLSWNVAVYHRPRSETAA
jgi:SAM-dependent methyltransferase